MRVVPSWGASIIYPRRSLERIPPWTGSGRSCSFRATMSMPAQLSRPSQPSLASLQSNSAVSIKG